MNNFAKTTHVIYSTTQNHKANIAVLILNSWKTSIHIIQENPKQIIYLMMCKLSINKSEIDNQLAELPTAWDPSWEGFDWVCIENADSWGFTADSWGFTPDSYTFIKIFDQNPSIFFPLVTILSMEYNSRKHFPPKCPLIHQVS